MRVLWLNPGVFAPGSCPCVEDRRTIPRKIRRLRSRSDTKRQLISQVVERLERMGAVFVENWDEIPTVP